MCCHVLVGTPKEMVSFKIMRMFNIEQVTLSVFDDADTVVTTTLVKDHIIAPLKKCRKLVISSTIQEKDIKLMRPYSVHFDDSQVNVKQCYRKCFTDYAKLLAILTVVKVIQPLKVQGIVFVEVTLV